MTKLQKLILSLILLSSNVSAAEIVSKINCTGEDYNTLTLWEDAKDGDLVTAEQIQTAEVYCEDGPLNDKVTIDGSTTNSSYYMKITVPSADRHAGTWDVSKTSIAPTTDGDIFTVDDEYVTIEWLQLYPKGTSATSYAINTTAGNSYMTVKNCLIDGHGSTNTAGIAVLAGTGQMIYRNIIWDVAGDFLAGILLNSNTGTPSIIGNTIYNCNGDYAYGIRERSSAAYAAKVTNNAVFDCDYNFDADESTWGSGSGYNATDSASAPGSNNQTSKTAANQFTTLTGGSENLHLKLGADCIDTGTTAGLTTDIDGGSVTGTYDIGADEYGVGGGGSGVPSSPTNLQGVAITTGTIHWTFTDNSSDETGFRLYNSTSGALVAELGDSVTFYTEQGLLSNTSYQHYVYAYNGTGNSVDSSTDTVYTLAYSPYGLSATAVYYTSFTVTFTTNNATSYNVYASTSSDFTVGVTTVNTTSATPDVTGLSFYTTYYIKATGLNGDGVGTTSYTNTITTRTLAGSTTTFGNTTNPTEAANDNLSMGFNICSKGTLTEYGEITKISAYMHTTAGSTNVKGAIWDNDGAGGGPGTLIAVSTATSVDMTAQWYDFTISTTLYAGDYYLGIIPGGDCQMYESIQSGNVYIGYGNDYTTPTDFSLGATTPNQMCNVYATYQSATFITVISTHLVVTVTGTSGEVQKCLTWTYPTTWQHIAITWDDSESTLTLYVNGTAQTLSTITGHTTTGQTDGRIYMGAQDTDKNFMIATMDEVGVFKRILTSTEINQIMNNGLRGNEPTSGTGVANIIFAE